MARWFGLNLRGTGRRRSYNYRTAARCQRRSRLAELQESQVETCLHKDGNVSRKTGRRLAR